MTTTRTPASGAADLLDLIEAYAEARHRQGHSSYNAQTAAALQAVKAALAAGQATAAATQPAPATQQAGAVRRAELVPGVMHCAKCKFQLNRVTLCVSDGNAYAGNNKTEPCPNGCGPLWPVTWEQEAKNCWKALEEMHERLMAAAAPQPSPTAQAAESVPAGVVAAIEKEIAETCMNTPPGWRCTRKAGHDGSCAAVPCPEELEFVAQGMDRLRVSSAPQPSPTAQAAESVAAPAGPSKSLPYEPTSAMLIAARERDPALPIETVRAIYWSMWRTAPTPPAQAADSVLEDAARWQWLADYLIGERTDLDEGIVACATIDALRQFADAARKQGGA